MIDISIGIWVPVRKQANFCILFETEQDKLSRGRPQPKIKVHPFLRNKNNDSNRFSYECSEYYKNCV